MRSYLPAYELRTARTLEEALAILGSEPGVFRPFAGGTDIMVLLEAGKLAHRRYVSIWGLPELRGIELTGDHVVLGALTTYGDLIASPEVARELPSLRRAAEETAAVAIQNRGTLGGNLANASPAADSSPALLAYDAEIELVSSAGARRVPYSAFHTGYRTTVARPDELIARIRVPRTGGRGVHAFRKVGPRRAQAISKVSVAAFAELEDGGAVREVRIALGSVAPTPLRATETEARIRGVTVDDAAIAAARELLEGEVRPIDDVRSTARYRRRVASNLVASFLERLRPGAATVPSSAAPA